MTICPQDSINRIWRLFAAQGISDDLQIIETLAYYLLRLNRYGEQIDDSDYPKPIVVNDLRTEELNSLLAEATANLSAAELFNHCLLFQPDNMRGGGQYTTPRHITRLIADLVRIFNDEKADIADFACGTGGLLVEFAHNNVTGIEISPTLARLARTNLSLHGQRADTIYTGNSLDIVEKEFAEQRSFWQSSGQEARKFDAIVMNPPFGSPSEAALVHLSLGDNVGTRSETVLSLLSLNFLKPNGVLAVLQPGGALFSTSSGEVTLRTRLLSETQLETIIQLPKDALQPYSQLQTYLLLARKAVQSSRAANTPVWFYQITHDGFSSGRNRQPQPDQSQLPQLVAAVEAGQGDAAWLIQDGEGVHQIDIRRLSIGGYRITQPERGQLTVHTLMAADQTALWLTRQQSETVHALVHDDKAWQQQQPSPDLRSEVPLVPLAFQVADESGQAISLAQNKEQWQLTLKSTQQVKRTEAFTGENGIVALLIGTEDELLSPPLWLEGVHKDYKPKTLALLPLENDGHEPAGTLLLWDCAAVNVLFFASERADSGWCLLTGEDVGALIGWTNGLIETVLHGTLQRSFQGEPWHRGVIVDAAGVRFGVGVDAAYICDERQYDLTFDRYYLPDENEAVAERSAAEILADMRKRQHTLAGRLDYLLGIVEMRPVKVLPSPISEAIPLGSLNHNQRLVWQRIQAMTEEAGSTTTAKPFRNEELAAGMNSTEVDQALTLFERMGLIVSVTIEGAPYYRRLQEQDLVTT